MKSGRKLGRTASHRKAMLSNLATSILEHERVMTTTPKAKEVRRLVERLITYGKKKDLHAIRMAGRYVKNKTVLKKLFDDIAAGYAEREGGYTRVVKVGVRPGDCAEMAIIELVARKGDDQRKRKKKKPATAAKASKAKAVAKAETVEAAPVAEEQTPKAEA
jgi:large subunit ribosomal protein L17